MFCKRCGKENLDTDKFCRYCGAELEKERAVLWMGLTATELIVFILFIVLELVWVKAALCGYGALHKIIGDENFGRFLGATVVYFIPGMLANGLASRGIKTGIGQKPHISIPLLHIGVSLIIKIGRMIFNKYSSFGWEMVCYYTFRAYDKVFVWTFIINCVLIGIISLKNRTTD